jgi:hypothetical protein
MLKEIEVLEVSLLPIHSGFHDHSEISDLWPFGFVLIIFWNTACEIVTNFRPSSHATYSMQGVKTDKKPSAIQFLPDAPFVG